MSLEVRGNSINDEADFFNALADDLDDLVAHLRAPALGGDALDGPELRPAEIAFEDVWRLCAADLSAAAESLRHLAALVKSAGSVYGRTDAAAASNFAGMDHRVVQSP